MSHAVSSCIFQAVCQHGGSLDFKTLDQILEKRFTVADEVFREALCDFDRMLVVEGSEKRADCKVFSPDSVIIAKTPLRVCQTLPGQCAGCESLHLCRYLICGNCRFRWVNKGKKIVVETVKGLVLKLQISFYSREKCKNSHALDSSHNLGLLGKFGLQQLGQSALFQLLLQNDPYLLPEVSERHQVFSFRAPVDLIIPTNFLIILCVDLGLHPL